MKKSFLNTKSGLSLVELMIGLTIFVIVVLSIGGAHQMIMKNVVEAKLAQKSVEFSNAEIDRMNRISRIPERDINENLVYRDTNNNLVVSGGSLVPYGYENFLTDSGLGGTHGEVVTYPDVLSDQILLANNLDRIQLRRIFSVNTFNQGNDDEYKEITVSLSDVQIPARFKSVTRKVTIKKPHPTALDTRFAKGVADLRGRVLDRQTQSPLLPGGSVIVTLTPNDETPPRFTATDAAGLFYFSPPLNTAIGYELKFEKPDTHWTRTMEITLKPGKNLLNGDSGEIAWFDPFLFAQADFLITDFETSQPLEGVHVTIFHRGTPPNSCAGSFAGGFSDINGRVSYTIKIPVPGMNTYDLYSLSNLEKSGYIIYWEDYGSPTADLDELFLDNNNPFQRMGYMVREKKGDLRVLVKKSNGTPNPKALVEISPSNNFAWDTQQLPTDSNGIALFEGITINEPTNALGTTRSYYIRVRSAHHRISETPVTLLADQIKDVVVNMESHFIEFIEQENELQVEKDLTKLFNVYSVYKGHTLGAVGGPIAGIDLLGPLPNESLPDDMVSFLGEHMTAGGFPGTWEFSGYDTSLITILGPQPGDYGDYRYLKGLNVGQTQITCTAHLDYEWNGVPYHVSKTRVYNVTVVPPGTGLNLTLTPDTQVMAPNASITFEVNSNPSPTDLTYSWNVTGTGAAQVQYLNSSGQVVSNNGPDASRCRIKASTQLGDSFNIGLSANSVSTSRHGTTSMNVEVNYDPLTISLDPVGPLALQSNNSIHFQATTTGGSGNYTIAWSLTDPATGLAAPINVGTLSNYVGPDTTFQAGAVTSVRVVATATDVDSGVTQETYTLIQIVPTGGTQP